MKKALKRISPLFLLLGYCLIAGGSLEDIGISLAITAGICVVIGIIVFISGNISDNNKREQGLQQAKDEFGNFTDSVEYQFGKYIVYDEPTNRIKLKDAVVDSRKIREIRTTRRDPTSKVTSYKEESVTKTSTGSAVGRSVIGALVAGPAGAIIGGATAKKKTEVKKTPEYHTIPGLYTIDVIDVDGNSRAKFSTHDLQYHDSVVTFLNKIISKNTLAERLALQAVEEENNKLLESADVTGLVIGGNQSFLEALLVNSSVIERSDSKQYKLCPKAIEIINRGWNSNFERVQLTIKDDVLSKFNGVSTAFNAGSFKNLLLEVSELARRVSESYGEPSSIAQDLSYTSLTEDSDSLEAYEWNSGGRQEHKLDLLFENGKYKYQLLLQQKNDR